jgi:hypothetical protein
MGTNQDTIFNWGQIFLTFIDNFSRKSFCYFLKNKSECFTKFQEFKEFAKSQSGNKIKVLRNDNNGEFTSKAFTTFFINHGIQH